MSSIIEQIYAALDGMSVTYLDKDNVSVTASVYTLAESLDSVQTADLPARLLILPTSQMVIGPGPEVTDTYTIQDLFLLEAVGQGGGSKVQAPVLLRYIVAYQDAIAKKWQILSTWQTEALTTNVTLTPGKYTYPANSDNVFYGVMVSITIEELY
jgi:hypothetical protein